MMLIRPSWKLSKKSSIPLYDKWTPSVWPVWGDQTAFGHVPKRSLPFSYKWITRAYVRLGLGCSAPGNLAYLNLGRMQDQTRFCFVFASAFVLHSLENNTCERNNSSLPWEAMSLTMTRHRSERRLVAGLKLWMGCSTSFNCRLLMPSGTASASKPRDSLPCWAA